MQGFIGWYMVQSGLTERTDVSHYRLSLHLTLAFIIYILLLWNYMNHKDEKGSNIDGKLMILDAKENIMRTIIDFLDLKYNEL